MPFCLVLNPKASTDLCESEVLENKWEKHARFSEYKLLGLFMLRFLTDFDEISNNLQM